MYTLDRRETSRPSPFHYAGHLAVGFGGDGSSYNINTDVAAGEIAAACGAERLIFLTDVAGILEQDRTLIASPRRWQLRGAPPNVVCGGA